MMNRRHFLQLAAAAAAVGIVIPAFAAGREPYVFEAENVIYIGLAGGFTGFTGSAVIKQVLPWDGVGFPCIVWDQSYHTPRRVMDQPIYDSELCNFLREVPADFWGGLYEDRSAYPNVHAWVREQRYGEDPATYWQRRDQVRAERVAA